jgi:hypothetical protein
VTHPDKHFAPTDLARLFVGTSSINISSPTGLRTFPSKLSCFQHTFFATDSSNTLTEHYRDQALTPFLCKGIVIS